MMRALASFHILAVFVACSVRPLAADDGGPGHTNVVIIGAAGDLATRYLWNAFFKLFQSAAENHRFTFYGCGRGPPDTGHVTLQQVLTKALVCRSHDAACDKTRARFRSQVFYCQTKTSDNYAELSNMIQKNMEDVYGEEWTSMENGRLFYLSVPPSVYLNAAANIAAHCKPSHGSQAWLRLVIEKPFGHDLNSARKLAEDLNKHFSEDQIYRVDHYLGKAAVQALLPFRMANFNQYEKLWNRHHIERVEIAMKETIDVKDRIIFFNEVGVIRDVMQNHLTELMVLVAMEMPSNLNNATEIKRRKLDLLNQIKEPSVSSVLIGQYASYVTEANTGLQEQKNKDVNMKTATFASVLLTVDSPRWQGVPFVLVTGKKLDEKSSFVRIVFKKNIFCIKKDIEKNICDGSEEEIRFQISPASSGQPEIIVSEHLPKIAPLKDWYKDNRSNNVKQTYSEKVVLSPSTNLSTDAYESVVKAVFKGRQELFVDSHCLSAAWEKWTPVIEAAQNMKPRIYVGHQHTENLNFVTVGDQLRFLTDDVDSVEENIDVYQSGQDIKMSGNVHMFREHPLVTEKLDILIEKLTEDIRQTAWESVHQRGSFHLALSGGKSPIMLFKSMASSVASFPWQHTHIWQVDERCVERGSRHSNMKGIYDHLLSNVRVPYGNFHEMPMFLQHGVCSDKDYGDHFYEDTIKHHARDGRLDYVLLGLGEDGHTASLFPNTSFLFEKNKLVTLSTAPTNTVSVKRMTLTFNLINSAHKISVLVMGKNKAKILQNLSSAKPNDVSFPITFVKPINGSLTWYVDKYAIT